MKNQLRTLLSTGCYPDYMSYTMEKKNRWRCSISAYKACVRRWKCGHLMKEYLLLSCVNQLNSTRKNFRMAAESTGIEDAERPNLLQDVSVLSSIRNTDHNQSVQDPNSTQRNQSISVVTALSQEPIRDSHAATVINEGSFIKIFNYYNIQLVFNSILFNL